MRLRNITKNVKEQNWFAVFLDFLIVVLGVFVGIQLGNWNEARQTRAALADAQARFVAENQANIATTDQFIKDVEGRLKVVSNGLSALRNCQGDKVAQKQINGGINGIRGTAFLSVRTTALDGLTEKDEFLFLLSEEERESLKNFRREVTQTQKTLDWLEEQPFRNHIEDYKGISFGDLVDLPNTDDSKIRFLSMDVPIEEACKDKDLMSKFYLWERTATFQHLRAKQLLEKLEANLE